MTESGHQRNGGTHWWGLFRESFNEWLEDKAPRLGAALAYYSAFSIAPLVLIVLAVAGWIFGPEAAHGRIIGEISGTVGEPVAKAIQSILDSAHKEQAGGILATVLGVITLLLGASGVFGQLQDALNTVWKVKAKPGRGLWGLIQDRFLSLTMVFGTGFLLLVSLVVTAGLTALTSWWTPESLPGGAWLWQIFNGLVSLALVSTLFALIFKVLPDVQVAWRDIWVGAVLTALLFTGGKYALGLYLARGSVTSAYGAAGSLVIILLWVYYSSLILVYGAEFTRVYARRYGSGVTVASDAVPVSRGERAREGMTSRQEPEHAAAGR